MNRFVRLIFLFPLPSNAHSKTRSYSHEKEQNLSCLHSDLLALPHLPFKCGFHAKLQQLPRTVAPVGQMIGRRAIRPRSRFDGALSRASPLNGGGSYLSVAQTAGAASDFGVSGLLCFIRKRNP